MIEISDLVRVAIHNFRPELPDLFGLSGPVVRLRTDAGRGGVPQCLVDLSAARGPGEEYWLDESALTLLEG